MNRDSHQKLTAMRLSDAKRLLKSRRNDAGAYYMAGYAIECAFKACIAKNMGQYPFPPKISDKDIRENYYTHNLTKLLSTAKLDEDFGLAKAANPDLEENWNIVKDWDEEKRYETQVSRELAESLIKAIEDPVNGVLTWLKKRW